MTSINSGIGLSKVGDAILPGDKNIGASARPPMAPIVFPNERTKISLRHLLHFLPKYSSTPSFLIVWVILGFFFMCDRDFRLIKGREVIENRCVLCTVRSAFERCVFRSTRICDRTWSFLSLVFSLLCLFK